MVGGSGNLVNATNTHPSVVYVIKITRQALVDDLVRVAMKVG